MKYIFCFLALLVSSYCCAGTPAPEGKIPVTGGSIWYDIKGIDKSAIPLVIIHGGPGSSSCNLGNLAAFAKERPVVFYDQLGAGKSDHPDNPKLWHIGRFVDELDQLLQHLGYPKVHLLAHSWGAAVAGQYLMDKGDTRIASVIYADPFLSSSDWVADTRELRKQLPRKTLSIFEKHEEDGTLASAEYQRASAEFYEKFLFHNPHEAEAECDDQSWNPKIYEEMWGDSEFVVTGNLKDFDVASQLSQIRIPTLFLIGEYDEVRPATAHKYQQEMLNADLVILKNAGHMSMVDEPASFVKAVNHFLHKVEESKHFTAPMATLK